MRQRRITDIWLENNGFGGQKKLMLSNYTYTPACMQHVFVPAHVFNNKWLALHAPKVHHRNAAGVRDTGFNTALAQENTLH